MREFIINNLNTFTSYGEEEKKNIKIFRKSKAHLLERELQNIEKIIESKKINKVLHENIEYEFCKSKNIKNTLKKLQQSKVLDEVELFEVKNLAISSQIIRENYEKLNLYVENVFFEDLEEVIKILDPDNLKLNTFQIYESYSNKLKEIRANKKTIENRIFKEIDGEIVNRLKDERLGVVIEEEKEESCIKEEISRKLYMHQEIIERNIKSIGKLDLLIAKANLAIENKGIKPKINKESRILLKELRNPSLISILEKNNKPYIPISIDLNKKVTLITGANMGGKSVSMKTIALNLYLFQCGMYVFAEEADLCVLDFVFLISEDMQNLDKGLSTFGGEIIKLKEIINIMKLQDGFVALDEFARGTNPKEGKILLKSICKYFKNYNSVSLISTHYDEILEDGIDHYQVIGLKNIDFNKLKYKIDLNKKESVSILQENMDYRLERVEKNKEVPKDALNICNLLGLQEEVIEIATKYYRGNDDEQIKFKLENS